MRKMVLLLLSPLAFAKVIDAIAIVVNGEPITTYEIAKTAQKYRLPPEKAVDMLIQRKLEDEQIKKLGLTIDDFELERAMEEFAKEKGFPDLYTFEQELKKRGMEWDEFKRTFRSQLLRKKLYDHISQKQLGKKIDLKKLKDYYHSHKDEFTIAQKIEIVKYVSPSKEVLEKIKENPFYKPSTPLLLETGREVVDVKEISPQFAMLLNQIPTGQFSQILPLGDRYLLIFVEKKMDKKTIPFEEAKLFILNKLANQNRASSIKEYFDRLRASANIEILKEKR
ncbi:MAG: hypothetical protein GXO61_00370 [Epsilonproteobacteria bacterium]|nr:hypothetical protein [Campylobacterota bacterium]